MARDVQLTRSHACKSCCHVARHGGHAPLAGEGFAAFGVPPKLLMCCRTGRNIPRADACLPDFAVLMHLDDLQTKKTE